MGYYHTIIDANIYIPASGFAPICKHLIDSGFTKPTEATAMGKTFSGGKTEEVFYAWTDTKKLVKCAEGDDLVGIFEEFGFEVQTDDIGSIRGLSYDSKAGDEEQLFRAIAPFMQDYEYISFRGEDGALYRYFFADQEMHICEGQIVFDMQK
jgi:hypothetical protein